MLSQLESRVGRGPRGPFRKFASRVSSVVDRRHVVVHDWLLTADDLDRGGAVAVGLTGVTTAAAIVFVDCSFTNVNATGLGGAVAVVPINVQPVTLPTISVSFDGCRFEDCRSGSDGTGRGGCGDAGAESRG